MYIALNTIFALFLMELLFSSVSTAAKIVGTEHKIQSVSAYDQRLLSIYLWEKHRSDISSRQFENNGRVVLLAHGATISGRVVFDLQIPAYKKGLPYSLMDYLAGQGYDVFSVDYQNYGRSDHHGCGLCVTTKVAAADLNSAAEYIRSLRHIDKIYVLGWSWGASTAGLFAQEHPEKVRRLVQYAPYLKTKNPELQLPQDEFRTVNIDQCCRDDFPLEYTDPGVYEAFAKEALKWDNRAPNGVLADFATRMPLIDPKQITVPTIMFFGALDTTCPIDQEELPEYFRDLATSDKQLIIIPQGGHALMMMKPRLKFYSAVTHWFELDQES